MAVRKTLRHIVHIMLRFIDQESIVNQTVLLRVDFNVPLTDHGEVADDSRIKYALPTIQYLLDKKNKIILLSHLGKPDGIDPHFSIQPVIEALRPYLPTYTITRIETTDGLTPPLSFADNEIKFLENIRFFKGEKANDPDFVTKLASLATIYVNDAFSVCHRKDASVIGLPTKLPSFAGMQLRKEITMLDRLINKPTHPFIAILGGSKISTKLPLIKKLAETADKLLIGGGMANTFLKAQGLEVGKSLIETEELIHAKELLATLKEKLVLPQDVLTNNQPALPSMKVLTKIAPTDAIYDIGPKSIEEFTTLIASAKTILWNGPVGFFEKEAFKAGTKAVIEAIIANPDAFTILGGGDTLSAIKDNKDKAKIDHISTGGGAMLTYIAEGTLPGIEALKSSAI